MAKTYDLILVFDSGTQSIRAGLVDLNGTLVDTVRTPIQPYFSVQQGFTEQEPDYYWKKFCETSQALIARNADKMDRVKAVAVTAVRGTYFNLDKNGQALRPAILWLDQRRIEPVDWAPLHVKAVYGAVGVFPRLDRYYHQCYSNWIRIHQPEIWGKTHKYLLQSGYFHYKLTGEYVETRGNLYGYLPVDRCDYTWAKKNDVVNLLFPIEREKLPALAKQGETIGKITHQASLDTGIREGLPLVAAAGDKMCEVLGDGVINNDLACLSYGTASTIDTITEKYLEPKPFVTPYPAAIPGLYMPELTVSRGFWLVNWFIEQFGMKEQQLGFEKGIPAESFLDDLIRNIPPGSQGLMLQPYWFPNIPFAGEEGKGAVIGFSDVHTRGHLYRAILEGVLYGLKDGKDILEAKLKKPFKALRVSGGGTKSQVVLQITADIFNLPTERLAASESGMVGAAINTAVGLGYYPDYATAIQSMVHVSQVVQPIARNRDIYNHLYERVYLKMYKHLEPMYKEIWNIADQFPEEMRKGSATKTSAE